MNTKTTAAPATLANCLIKREGNVLYIGIDTSKTLGPSKSGKTTLVGTTHGIIDVGDGVQLSVNAFRKVAKTS